MVHFGARRGRTEMRAQRGAVNEGGELAFDTDADIPARQIKWVPTEHSHGLHVIATFVEL